MLTFVPLAHADSSVTWPIQSDRSTDTKHGLYEIQKAAARFVRVHNKKHGTTLVAGEPNTWGQVLQSRIATAARS